MNQTWQRTVTGDEMKGERAMTEHMQPSRPEGLTRRHVLGKAIGFGAVAVAASVGVKAVSVGAQPAERYVTTAALNLRAGPSTRDKVILVIPKGATVHHLWDSKNGFLYVGYKHQAGWAHRDYLRRSGPANIGPAMTRTNVNLRSGPGTSYKVIVVLPKGTTVTATDQVHNGFRYVHQHSGPSGWVSDRYLQAPI